MQRKTQHKERRHLQRIRMLTISERGKHMLYKKNSAPSLAKSLFENPTSEFRGTPFWAWNSKLEGDELCRQIDVFKEMGLGGFHMHVRTGLENEYLSDEYMSLVRTCVDKAKKEEMLAWLYDEDRWPSGAAGGIVTKDKKYRERFLVFSHDYDKTVDWFLSRANGDEEDQIRLLTVYDIVQDEEGYLLSNRQIGKDDEAKGEKWYLFRALSPVTSWHNDQTYIDTLNPEATTRFLEVTHERYKEVVGDEFDKTVPAIFTDEPQVYRKHQIANSFDTNEDIKMPWTDRFPEEYKKRYGTDVFDHLPEIIWELPKGVSSPHRYYYHDLVGDLFAEAFADNIGGWCERNNISLTGHMMEEPTLESQTHSTSEAMRSYRSFGLPGIDMLCNSREFTTAKQCQSAVHQYGKEGMLSELYGVTSWDADFRKYKFGGDWQAALGVTIRVPHLSWYAMQGEAKRDYPASISYQSPWYKQYHLVEDHFSRLNTALTRGKPVIRVGVVHPVESYWLHYGPNDKTEKLRKPMEERFKDVTNWLLEGSIDFNFISESLLPELCDKGSYPLKVGKMEYDAIVVPGCETIRSTTIDRLKGFAEAGGKLIFMGNAPALVDAVPSDKGINLCKDSKLIDFGRAQLLEALEENRDLTIRYANGNMSYDFLYQLRQDEDCRWLFVCHNNEPANMDCPRKNRLAITVKGEYTVELWDTYDGSVHPVDVAYRNGNTIISQLTWEYDSFLYRLVPGKKETKSDYTTPDMTYAPQVKKCSGYSLTEKNSLVLDMAEYAVDGGDFMEKEEILRLDNKARKLAGLRERGGSVVQPWAVGNVPAEHTITLRFTIQSDIDYKGAELALEDADKADIVFNGEKVDNTILGTYVDIKIFRVALPEIKKGENTLVVTLPLGERTNTENMFILGDFGVAVTGQDAKITALPDNLFFGNVISQGLPFYGGGITYKFDAESKGGKLNIKASNYRGAVIEIKVDGEVKGHIIYPPYILTVEGIEDGNHSIEMTLYPHRYNTFGPIHLTDWFERWHGPGAWRSDGDRWSYEYVLRPVGILSAPKYN